MIARRDVILDQIERLARILARAVTGERPAHRLIEDAEQAASLGLDIAERLPVGAITGLLTHKDVLEAPRALVLGIGLIERARQYVEANKPGYGRRAAKRAIQLIELATNADPSLATPQLEEVLVTARAMV